jgi:ABC-type multidrug transport system fused ATPase/permease subunit
MRVCLPRRWSPSPTLAGTLAVLCLLPSVSRSRTALLALGVLCATALPLGVTIDTGVLVGAVPATVRGGLDSPAGQEALSLLVGAGALIIAGRLLAPVLAALAGAFGRQVDRYLQERVMAAVGAPRGVAHLEDPAVLDLIKNAQGIGGEGIRPGAAVGALAALLPSWLQALGSALILAAFHWWLALAWFLVWPIVTHYFQREYIRVGAVASGQASAVRRAEYYRTLALTPDAAKEVRIWSMLDWLTDRFDEEWQAAMRPVWRARAPGRPVIWVCTGVVVALDVCSLGLLVWAATHGEIGLGALAIYMQAVLGANAFRAFDTVNTHLAYAAVAVPSLLRLERDLGAGPRSRKDLGPWSHGLRSTAAQDHRDLPEPTSVGVVPPMTPLRQVGPSQAICCEDVGFRYPGRSTDTLTGLDLVIPAGRSLAVVGANGAGKTTLVKLLCRLYEPTAGRIVVDGADLRDTDPRAWQRRVAAIFQDFARYQFSARDNVALGARELARDLERLRAAARRAGALELIESLPYGWDTVLSRQYTAGVDLSGGQWQRVALARALLAVEAGARLLILDEPTAALDVRAEAELYDRFLDITAGLTTILISHRFSTVRRADRICVLADGHVVEQGTHDQLMALGQRYAEMFTLQAARFAAGTSEDDEKGG